MNSRKGRDTPEWANAKLKERNRETKIEFGLKLNI
jgi:hypothetical protein